MSAPDEGSDGGKNERGSIKAHCRLPELKHANNWLGQGHFSLSLSAKHAT
jgi:hypothetical protein